MSRFILITSFALAGGFCERAAGQRVEEETRESVRNSTPDKSESPPLGQVAESITKQTNAFRKEERREPLSPNEELTATAQYFADYMARTNEYGHTADGNQPSQRAKKHGYEYCIVLENIAYAYNSAGFTADKLVDKFVTGWKESPGHRKNMLDPDVTETGVAVARSEKTGYYYAVQMFGRPKSEAIEFKIENTSGEEVSYRIGERTFELPPRVIRTHTSCRPEKVQFFWPGDDEPDTTITPETGNRFIITRDGKTFAVKKASR